MSTLSVLAAALEASRKGRYAHANKNSPSQVNLNDIVRFPHVTDAEVTKMSESVAPALCNISCYEVMGTSTQVVVVEENSPLTIPFIAAQETQVSTCFVWSAERRRYTGVLSITEYVKVLLFCESNPQEVERVSSLSVKQWLDLKREQQSNGGDQNAPEALVSATADESLAVCIERMLANRVRRLAVVADDADDPRFETSILTVITFDILIQQIASRLFSTAVFSTSSPLASRSAMLPPSVQSIVADAGPDDEENEVLGQAVGSATGAYRTIFDIPYARLPRLGKAAQYKAAHGRYPAPAAVGASTPIATALRMLVERQLHSIAVIDDNNGPVMNEDGGADTVTGRPIMDTVTRNDAIRMESGGVFNLQISVREALTHTTHNGAPRPLVAVFYETDTLREIIEHFATRRVPVLFLIDPKTDGIVAQLSITEVFSFLSESSTSGGQ